MGQYRPIIEQTPRSDSQIDVEGPSPGRVAGGKGSTDHGSKDTPEPPDESDPGDIEAALLVRGAKCHQIQGSHVDARASDAGDDPTDDQGVHGGCRSADSRADFEDGNAGDKDPFDVELGVESSPTSMWSVPWIGSKAGDGRGLHGEDHADRAEREARSNPRQLADIAKGLDDRSLDVGGDGGVQTEEKGRDVDGSASKNPFDACGDRQVSGEIQGA